VDRSSFAAVDLGASSGRVIVGRLQGGRILTDEVARFPNGPVPVPAGRRTTLHWDVLRLYASTLEGLRRAGRVHGPVAGIGIDSWAVDYGLLDADGALLGNPVHYRDGRTVGLPDRVFEHIDAGQHYAHTGVQVQPFNTVFQLAASARTAQLGAARRLLLLPDLLGHWLTGAEVAEVTNASTTGLLDVTHRRWSSTVLHALHDGFAISVAGMLPPLVEPGTVIGPLRDDVAAELALEGTEVVAVGSHDTASAVVAVPATTEDFAYVSCGTWSLVGLELDGPVLTEASRRANFTNELGVDGTVRFLRNVMGLWLLQECVRTWQLTGEEVDLAGLLAAAADVPPLSFLVDVDHPDFLPPGDMPARIAASARPGVAGAGTGGRTGTGGSASAAAPARTLQSRAEIVRCILDSLALAYRRAVRQAAALAGRRVEVVHVVGGGARNTLLCQLTADATGLPVVAGPTEGAALGNLVVQARALGDVDGDLARLREIVAASSETVRYAPSRGSGADWAAAERIWD